MRLLDKNFLDQRIIEKILVTILERYRTTISSLEMLKIYQVFFDRINLKPYKFKNKEDSWEKKKLLEGALWAQIKYNGGKENKTNNNKNGDYPSCTYCKKTNHPQHKC